MMLHIRSRTALCVALTAALAAAPPVDASSVVTEWNETMLAAVRANAPRPTVVSRMQFVVSSAIYDAWAAYDATALASVPANRGLRRPGAEHSEANRRIAVSHAAYVALLDAYPGEKPRFDAFLAQLGLAPSTSTDPTTPEGVGRLAALAVLAARAQDGSNAGNNFSDTINAGFALTYASVNSADPLQSNAPGHTGFNASRWQPLRVPNGTVRDASGYPIVDPAVPTSYADQRFLTPHWGGVRTFAAGDPKAYLPPPPPQAGSTAPYVDALGNHMTNDEAWHVQVDQVLEFSATLGDREKVIAEFWADGPRSETPPGHWNQLAQGVSMRDGNDIGADARMFFALNGALMDAGIVTWYVKRTYDSIRPVSAIRHLYAGQTIAAWGGPDLGTRDIPGESWRPYQDPTFVTPPFPEFTSGHSAFSAAAAEVLTELTGSEVFHDGVTHIDQDLNEDGIDDYLGEHIALPGSNHFEDSPAATVTLRWPTFKEAADEAGISRLYGGIHIQDGDLHGRHIGEQVGLAALRRARALFAGNRPIEAGLAGTWYHPDRSGEGFTLDLLPDGRMLVAWYTYDDAGRQVWLSGLAEVDENGVAQAELRITDGPRFGPAYDPADLNQRVWGQVRLRFDGCDHGEVSYTPSLPGFASGSHALQRLTAAAGAHCVE